MASVAAFHRRLVCRGPSGLFAALLLQFLRPLGWLLASMLGIQFSLGVANVLAGLPLAVADAHNAGAALLLGSLVVVNFFAFHGLRPRLPKA